MPARPISLAGDRARLAGITARHGAGSERAAEARRDYRAAKLAEHIRLTVDAAPPLSSAQRDQLAALLRPAATEPDQKPTAVAS